MPLVTTAVVPVAGLGTRLLPATKSQPKEMLPVGGKPVVQHVVEELARAGVRRIVFVTGRGKESIERHFDDGFEHLGLTFVYARQPAPRGLGDAVLCAEGLTGDGPFAVALGDAIFGTREPPDIVARLAAAREEHDAACAVAVRDVPREQTGRYGIVSARDGDGETATATCCASTRSSRSPTRRRPRARSRSARATS